MTAVFLGCVLTFSALLHVDGNMEMENYVKFAIFILLLPHMFRVARQPVPEKRIKLVGCIVYIQVALIILGYFFASFTEQIANAIGFHISARHEIILTREPFNPLKRSFSIFDNPNVAGRLLILSFIFYASIASRVGIVMLFLVLVAAMATGSRAALFVLFFFVIWAAFFHKTQSSMFKLVLIVVVGGLTVAFTAVTISVRVFDVSTMLVSAAMKVGFAMEAFSNSDHIEIYDTDIALAYHQFGLGGLFVLFVLILQLLLNVRGNMTFLACAYCFSGSLIFSTPNIAALLILKFIGRSK